MNCFAEFVHEATQVIQVLKVCESQIVFISGLWQVTEFDLELVSCDKYDVKACESSH